MDWKYALLWILGLAMALLAVAAIWSLPPKEGRPNGGRTLLRWMLTAVPLVGNLILVVLTYNLWMSPMRPDWFWYVLSWGVVCHAASITIAVRARRAPLGSSRQLMKGAGAAFLLFIGVYFWIDLDTRGGLEKRRIAALETIARLTPPAPPEEENAAPLYREALAAMMDPEDWPDGAWSYFDRPSSEVSIEEIRDFLDANDVAIDLTLRAAQRPRFHLERSSWMMHLVDTGETQVLPWNLIQLAHLLRQRALLAAREGDPSAAYRFLTAIRRMARHGLQEKRDEISLAIALGLLGTEVSTLESLLTAFPTTAVPPVYAGLGEDPLVAELPAWLELVSADYELVIISVMMGEKTIAMLSSHDDGAREMMEGVWGILGRPLFYAYWQFYRVFLAPAEMRALDNHVAAYRRRIEEARPEPIGVAERLELGLGFLTGMLITGFEHSIISAFDTQCRLDLRRLALAAHAFRLERGFWPARLDDLVPRFIEELPRDVHGQGESYLSVRAADGLILYSQREGELPEDDEELFQTLAASTDHLYFALGPPQERIAALRAEYEQ